MTGMRRVFITILITNIFFIQALCLAQSTKEEKLRKIYGAMQKLSDFGLEVHVDVYQNSNDRQPWKKYKTALFKKGDKVRRELASTTYIYSNGSAVIIDSAEKTVHFIPEATFYMKSDDMYKEILFSQWLKNIKKITYLGTVEDSDHFVLDGQAHNIKRIYIFTDRKTNLFKKIIYQYETNLEGQPHSSTLRYLWKRSESLHDSLFDISQYVYTSSNGYQLGKGLEGYELIIKDM